MRVIAAAALFLVASPLAAADIEGRWRSPGGNSIIEIAPCGNEWCGTVAWASEKAKQDAAKATDQLIGTPLLTELQTKRPGEWRGKLFVPDQNLRVRAKLTLIGEKQLKVSGCAIICKSQIWNRFEEPLPQ